ncbi:MAG TPA: hypothetical protein VJ773_07855, partial [Gemmatimonadales bacterium]|nr:hypothetical protein [Gemmatimonadales bacterium]
DFARALGDPGYAATAVGSAHGGRNPPSRRLAVQYLPWALAGILAVVVAAWRPWASAGRATDPVLIRYEIQLPDSARHDYLLGDGIAYSTDGSVFAYRSAAGILLHHVDRLGSVPVTGARRGAFPFFSPDGRWLGFRDGARILKVPLAGGTPIVICDSCTGYQTDWGTDDTVRYHTQSPYNPLSRELMAVPAAGGTPRQIARPDSGTGIAYRYPILVPGTRTVLFTRRSADTDRLAALDLDSGALTEFEQTGGNPRWVDPGHVVLANRDLSLVAVPFDARKGRPSGPPTTIARDVLVGTTSDGLVGVSRSGSIVYVPAVAATNRGLAIVSRDGRATPLAVETRGYEGPRLSPDGGQLAIGVKENTGGDVWVLDLAQQSWSRITTTGFSERPVWTPDGRRLVYATNADLWWVAADGSGRPDSLLIAAGNRYPASVTPDNRSVVFQESGSLHAGLRRLAFDSAPAAEVILPTGFEEAAPDLSPDGRWLAYQSEESGRNDVYVRPFPGPGARVSVSVSGGTEPAWSRDGRSLFYRAGDSMLVATIAYGTGLTVLDRKLLFVGPYLRGARFREYDVSPDGQRFYMVTGRAAESSFIAIHHFFDRLALEGRRPR